jgi:hypothetical protein
MSDGHSDHAARRSLLDLPDIDLLCPSFMILPDGWESPRFLESRPTQCAADLGYARRFQAVFVAQAGSVKAALSRPTQQYSEGA